MSRVTIEIMGKPCSKGRPRFQRVGNYVRTYTPDKTVEYENLVRLAWMQSGAEKLEGKVSANITAHFPIPKSVSKKKRVLMDGSCYDKKPDCDNIAKIILDSLNGVAYDDDAQVVSLCVTKLYDADESKVVVVLQETEEED